MDMHTTVGKILLKNNVPESLRPHVQGNVLDKKGIGDLFSKLSEGNSDVYKDYVTRLARLGFEVSTRLGSTVPLNDLMPIPGKEERFNALEKEIDEIRKGTGTKIEKENKIIKLYGDFTKKLEDDILSYGVKNNHTLAKVILSGSRGSKQQYRQTVASPVLVSDEKGRPITDFPLKHSFAEGLTIPEYLLHSYGTRQGAIATKLAIADSGFFSKQLARSSYPLKIEEHDCGTHNGIPVHTTDKDSLGTYLAHPVGDYKRNNEVTGAMLADLRDQKINEIIVRSPITCQATHKSHTGAICQLCAGNREKGKVPELGTYIGITAATALGEPLSQGQLNTKHTAGSASLGKTVASGFKLIEQLANPRRNFPDKAAVTETDGKITGIKKLPQGGTQVEIHDGKKTKNYYVPAGFLVHNAIGDQVEAGDILSEGVVNPADIVKYKGIGEGRRYFTEAMRRAFDEAGMGVNRRNFEAISRGHIDHVKITHPDGLGDHLPDEIVSYQAVEKDYKPRTDAKLMRTDQILGKYLEEPVLHYSIGTKATTKMIEQLKKHNIQSVHVHDDKPHFEPEMQRLLDVPAHVPDWAHQLYSTYLEKRLINAVNTGMSTNLKGPSPIMGLAYGVGFGEPE